jgi:hypothetical protein
MERFTLLGGMWRPSLTTALAIGLRAGVITESAGAENLMAVNDWLVMMRLEKVRSAEQLRRRLKHAGQLIRGEALR